MTECTNLNIIDIVTELNEYDIRSTLLRKLVKSGSGETAYSQLSKNCENILTTNSLQLTPLIKNHLDRYIKNLFFLNHYSISLSTIITKEQGHISSINIINDINKLIETESFNLINNHKSEACDMIQMHQSTNSIKEMEKNNLQTSLKLQ